MRYLVAIGLSGLTSDLGPAAERQEEGVVGAEGDRLAVENVAGFQEQTRLGDPGFRDGRRRQGLWPGNQIVGVDVPPDPPGARTSLSAHSVPVPSACQARPIGAAGRATLLPGSVPWPRGACSNMIL